MNKLPAATVFLALISFATPWMLQADELPQRLARVQAFVGTHCIDCHHQDEASGGLDLEGFDFSAKQFGAVKFDSTKWEKILQRLHTRQMPPVSADRPSEKQYLTITRDIAAILDNRAAAFPQPGRVSAVRRMTRLEYQNAIRDLLAVNIDAANYLPKDESSHGFDNITVGELSPTHLNRYLSAAQRISRAAIGALGNGPVGVTLRLPADRTQDEHVRGLPFGTRGGMLVEQHFPQDGLYEIELKLTRDRDEKVEGLDRTHQIDVLVDRARVHSFTVRPPKGSGGWQGRDYTHSDSHLHTRIRVTAGRHQIGVTFPKTASSLQEIKRQPFDASFNRHRHPRRTPALYQVSIVGPFDPAGPGDTQSRRLIFGSDFDLEQAERTDAHRILKTLAYRAYRRPVHEADMTLLMQFFDKGAAEGGFEKGIETALAAMLVNPNFLFRIEVKAATAGADEHVATQNHGVTPVESFALASRLSFFLWSSIPDQELLDLAANDKLQREDILRQQVRRMLADERSASLVNNFAAQWLYLRNLDSITPDLRLFPGFDDNLRIAFRRETELLFEDVLQNDRSVLKLIRPGYTFLNQRLATHYGVPGIKGSKFRRVETEDAARRGGILRHGSVLMATSYATRTSPTIRGNWVMANIFGSPAPPPPPDVPNLKEKTALQATSVRERLAAHRANPSCASCHDLIDPVGFALENFDAVGRWRQFDGELPVDSAGSLPDGTTVNSVEQLEEGILKRPGIFARTLTSKLLTFALGRTLQPADGPAVRRIVKQAGDEDYKMSAIITGIVLSKPFRMRSTLQP